MVEITLVDYRKYEDVLKMSLKLHAYEANLSPTCDRGDDAQASFWRAVTCAGRLGDRDTLTWLAYDGDTPVGMLQISARAIIGTGSGLTMKTDGWWVDPEFRDLGVSRRLGRAAAKEPIARCRPRLRVRLRGQHCRQPRDSQSER